MIEVKVVRGPARHLVAEGLAQTGDYMDRAGTREGHLVLFDLRPNRTWAEKLHRRARRDAKGREITVWGA